MSLQVPYAYKLHSYTYGYMYVYSLRDISTVCFGVHGEYVGAKLAKPSI